nr:iron dependent repressor, metal binding and dimerization domain protein [Candidatus Sigynarchaeota archaeon]
MVAHVDRPVKVTSMDIIDSHTLEYNILIEFLHDENQKMRPREIAQKVKVPHSTVNSAIKRMKDLIEWEPYGYIKLSEDGKDQLHHIRVHLHLIETFLTKSLGMDRETATGESLVLAPHFSCRVIKAICDKYQQPKRCTCNEIIEEYPACHKHLK